MQRALKFRYSEKATKIWKNLLTLGQKKVEIFFQIFVAFSKYLNFTVNCIFKVHHLYELFSIYRIKNADPRFCRKVTRVWITNDFDRRSDIINYVRPLESQNPVLGWCAKYVFHAHYIYQDSKLLSKFSYVVVHLFSCWLDWGRNQVLLCMLKLCPNGP